MRFQSYDQFLNESFLEKAKSLLKKIGDFFTGVGSRILNALILQKEKKLPKGVTIYPSQSDIKLLSELGVNVQAPTLKVKEIKESIEPVDEAVVKTEYPDRGKIQDVHMAQLVNFIKDTVEGGKNVRPLLIWGAPGIAKTAIINTIAKEYFGKNAKQDKRLIDFDLMTISSEEFFMPYIKDKDTPNPKSSRLPDEWLPMRRIDEPGKEDEINGADGKGGIIFFDEIARCSIKVQNVCLTLMNERRLGSYVLGEKWAIIAAANRKSDLSDDEQEAFHWSSTLANRMVQINFASTIDDWTPWAMTAKDDLGQLIVKPEIVAFLRFNSNYYHLLDPETFSTSSGGSEAWPSPRSWTNASDAIKAREKRYEAAKWKDKEGKIITQEKWKEEQESILSANVGPDASSAFVGFQALMQKINPEDIKLVFTDGKKAPKWTDLKLDEKYALIASACFQMKDKKTMTKDQMKNFGDWLIVNKDAPNAIKAMRMITDVVPGLTDDDYWNDSVWFKMVEAYPNVFSKEKV
jgi:hypothetical protein